MISPLSKLHWQNPIKGVDCRKQILQLLCTNCHQHSCWWIQELCAMPISEPTFSDCYQLHHTDIVVRNLQPAIKNFWPDFLLDPRVFFWHYSSANVKLFCSLGQIESLSHAESPQRYSAVQKAIETNRILRKCSLMEVSLQQSLLLYRQSEISFGCTRGLQAWCFGHHFAA